MNDIGPFLACLGLPLLGVLTISVVMLWSKLGAMRSRMELLEERFRALARDVKPPPMKAAWPIVEKTTPAVSPPTPAQPPKVVPSPVVSTPVNPVPISPPKIVPPVQLPVISIPPMVPQPQGGPTSERLLEKLDEVRAKERAPVAEIKPLGTETARVLMPPISVPPRPRKDKKAGLEAYLGAKLFVVVGAIALALAAVLLVKYMAEHHYFNAQRRVIAGTISGLILIAAAQWRRKFEAFIAQGLAAAGIVALFAATYAAASLYHYILPWQGFALLASVTAAAVGMSLQDWGGRSGMLIAGLGLIGGFITPLLIRTDVPNVRGLFAYLLVLHVGLVIVTRMRGWTILAALSVLFSTAWMLIWLLTQPWNPEHGPILGVFMLASVVTMVVGTSREPEKWRGNFAVQALTWLSGVAGLLMACLLLGRSGFSDMEWTFFAALVAGAFTLGRLRNGRGGYEGLAWVSAFVVLVMLMTWGGPEPWRMPAAEFARLRWWMTGFGVASVLAAYGCQWGSAAPVRWGLLSVLLTAAYVGAAYAILGTPPRPDEWGYLPLAAAVVMGALTVPVLIRRAVIRTGEETLAVYAHGVLGLLMMAVPMAWTDARLTAGWSALLPIAALIIWRLRVPGLLFGFLGVLLAVVLRTLDVDQWINAGGPGRTLFWNPVVWTFGSIVAAMGVAAWVLERCAELPPRLKAMLPGPRVVSAILQAGSAAAGFMLVTLEVRWYFHAGQLNESAAVLTERGTFTVAWLLIACVLTWVGQRMARTMLVCCGEVAGVIGMVYAVAILVIVTNPLWWGDAVGARLIFNDLLYVYGVPALLCGVLVFILERTAGREKSPLSWAAGAVGLLLTFVMVSLQVRQGFVGERLGVNGVSFREWGTYTIAWLVLGALCVAVGLRFARELLWRAGILLSVGGLGYGMAVVGVIMSPLWHRTWVGEWLIWNELLYAYGAPALLCAVVAWMVAPGAWGGARWLVPAENDERMVQGRIDLGRAMRAGVAMLLFILVTTEVRQGFQGAYLDKPVMEFVERGTYVVAWLALAGAWLWAGFAFNDLVTRRAGLILAWAGLGASVLVCAGIMNPLWTHEAVGSQRILNWLLYEYGIPAAGAGILSWALSRRTGSAKVLGYAAGVAGLFLTFVLVTLEVQHWFRAPLGQPLAFGVGPYGEMTAYSLSWAILGGIYLTAGILLRNQSLRWASLIVMLVTVVKVFVFDLADLKDLERVASFTGLGVSLMALAFVYQRFVLRAPEQKEDSAAV